MALADELCELRDRIQTDLKRASDYCRHSDIVWRIVQRVVDGGYQFSVENLDTGTRIDGPELAGLGQGYVLGYLAESVFQHYVSLFEDFTFGLIGSWLAAYPQNLVRLGKDDKTEKIDKSVPLYVILDSPDKDSIIRSVIERELDRVKYRRLTAWFDYLENVANAKLGLPTEDQLSCLAEIKALRDILVHNRGIVNKTYIDKAGPKARYAEGDRLEISGPYLGEGWSLISQVVNEVSSAAIAKATRAAARA